MDQTALKIASLALSVGVGIFVATTVGFPVTVLGGIGMVLVMTITSIAVRIVIKGAAHLSACAAGAALAVKERFC
jgi:membrane associated rhomboid family serine protease